MTIEYSINKVDKVSFLKSYNFLNIDSSEFKFDINPSLDLIKFDYDLEENNIKQSLNYDEFMKKYEESKLKKSVGATSARNTKVNENEIHTQVSTISDKSVGATSARSKADEEVMKKLDDELFNLQKLIKSQLEAKQKEVEFKNSKIINSKLNEVIDEIRNLKKQNLDKSNDETSKNKHINIIINAENPIFSDIKFTIDKSKVKLNSQNIKQNIMSGATLGSSNMLDAISEQKFAVILGRKTANLRNLQNQNHDCIDALVQNGLMGSPKIMSEYSVGKILIELTKFDKINLYIIHSALQVNSLEYDGISVYNVPRYTIGDGEILSVFFRYIAILFFPYLSITNISDTEYKYDL